MTTTAAYETHRLADLIPAMTDSEFADLREDIAANGLLDPVVLYEGKILDGRHRYRACEETGVWPAFTQYEGDSPAAYVISHNLKRRSLSQSQKAMVASDFVPELAAESEAMRSAIGRASVARRESRPVQRSESSDSDLSDPQPLGRSAKRAAERFGVGHAQVIRANRIKREDPDLAERVRSGEVTVTGALAQLPPTNTPPLNGHKPQPEPGAVRPAAISRIAEQAAGIAMAVEALAINKSCERMTPEDRTTALDSCKAGLRALNTMAKALGR